jgi:hypothetical protein
MRAYTCAELVALLARAGLASKALHGGWDGAEFGSQSWRLMITAQRDAA